MSTLTRKKLYRKICIPGFNILPICKMHQRYLYMFGDCIKWQLEQLSPNHAIPCNACNSFYPFLSSFLLFLEFLPYSLLHIIFFPILFFCCASSHKISQQTWQIYCKFKSCFMVKNILTKNISYKSELVKGTLQLLIERDRKRE